MKKTFIGLVVATFLLTGCVGSWFTRFDEVAIDKHYITTQCPTFNHQFDIKAKKYTGQDGEGDNTLVVMSLNGLTSSLAANTQARDTFNTNILESNQTRIVMDTSGSEHRQIKKIFVDRTCPKYTYQPEFKAHKLSSVFEPKNGITYVIISLEKMLFETQKHRETVETYNVEVDRLNN